MNVRLAKVWYGGSEESSIVGHERAKQKLGGEWSYRNRVLKSGGHSRVSCLSSGDSGEPLD